MVRGVHVHADYHEFYTLPRGRVELGLVESGYWSSLVADQFCMLYGLEEEATHLFKIAKDRSPCLAGNLLARSSIEARRDLSKALFYAKRAREAGPDPLNILDSWQAHIERLVNNSLKK